MIIVTTTWNSGDHTLFYVMRSKIDGSDWDELHVCEDRAEAEVIAETARILEGIAA